MANIEHRRVSQSGAALLFALGILSLLLISGVAFLGNALITQKVMLNNEESASAKTLAHAALNRAMAHLSLFNLSQVAKTGYYYASDASSVYSRSNADTFNPASSPLLSVLRDGLYVNDGDDATNKENRSLLTVKRSRFLLPSWYNAEKTAAQWVYVHEDGTYSDGQSTTKTSPIVGRFAYQVVPQSSSSRLSLFAVTAGGSAGGVAKIESTSNSTYTRIPQKHRWGLEVDELLIPGIDNMFEYYWKNGSAELCDPLHEFDTFISMLSGNKSAVKTFLNDSIKTENRKRWLEHVFVEGAGRVAREAYAGDIVDGVPNLYPRFNLGEHPYYYDADKNKRLEVQDSSRGTWYHRFIDLPSGTDLKADEKSKIDALLNNSTVIDRLTAVPDKTNGRISDSFYIEQHNEFGLPFLRRIGDDSEKGSWGSMEHLRKQIAANLNDYCDADSIPTSNIPAKSWSSLIKSTTGLPEYTGNEQTPYINELAFGFKLSDAKFAAGAGKFDFEANLSAEVIAELIRIYKSIVPDNITTAELEGHIRSMEVTFKIAVKGKATGTYTKSDGTPGNITNLTLDYDSTEATASTPAKFEGKDFKIQFNSGVVGGGPYWIKNKVLEGDPATVKISLYDKLKELAKAAESDCAERDVTFDVVPENIEVQISKLAFNLGNLVLTAELPKDDGSGTSERVGIDFVKFPADTSGTELIVVTDSEKGAFESLDDLNKGGIFHFGSLQAIDPRQNLNAKFQSNGVAASSNVKESDWFLSVVPAIKFQAKTGWEWGEDKLATRVAEAEVNKCSKPDGPFLANSSVVIEQKERDTEKAADPAWRGDGDDKHISTAVIRNAPMRSPWELGFIHRGLPFQTINLKTAGGFGSNLTMAADAHKMENFPEWGTMTAGSAGASGTKYSNGDAGILDQIKMTPFNKSYGKVDLSALVHKPANWLTDDVDEYDTLSFAVFKALFSNLKSHKAVDFVEKVSDLKTAPQNLTESDIVIPDDKIKNIYNSAYIDGYFRSRILGDNSAFFDLIKDNDGTVNATYSTDAAKEEIIGKTVNLLETKTASVPNVFKIVVVAQKIRDLEGNISRYDINNDVVNPSASNLPRIGRFDADIRSKAGQTVSDTDHSIYYDEITGVCRMLVTVEKIHYLETDGTAKVPRARLRVKQIEYLD